MHTGLSSKIVTDYINTSGTGTTCDRGFEVISGQISGDTDMQYGKCERTMRTLNDNMKTRRYSSGCFFRDLCVRWTRKIQLRHQSSFTTITNRFGSNPYSQVVKQNEPQPQTIRLAQNIAMGTSQIVQKGEIER